MGEDLSNDMPEPSESEPVPGKIGDTEIWWLPFVALGFFHSLPSFVAYFLHILKDQLLLLGF